MRGEKDLYLPIQINKKYHESVLRNSDAYVKVHNNKVTVSTTSEVDDPVYKDQKLVV
jgi:FKBP-type peptidyl-prolyl cis-trans isomerase (trigger factor)